jgi:GAF domain-containing protein
MHDPSLETPWNPATPKDHPVGAIDLLPDRLAPEEKRTLYADLGQAVEGLLAGESDWIANTANVAASIYHSLPALNWAGFYFLRGDELVLGPFQGKPACVRIPIGKGVCGTAAEQKRTILVPDVHAFPGHIACDAASRSELVVPLLGDGQLLGVLDLDSPIPNRFDDTDRAGCERLVDILLGAGGTRAG